MILSFYHTYSLKLYIPYKLYIETLLRNTNSKRCQCKLYQSHPEGGLLADTCRTSEKITVASTRLPKILAEILIFL